MLRLGYNTRNGKELQMDIIKSFMLENGLFRGKYIAADSVVADIWEKHDYPEALRPLLTQAVLIALALSAGIKYQGVFSLQIKGDGPISSLFVDVTTDRKVRGYMRLDDSIQNWSSKKTLVDLFGRGQLIFSVAGLGQEPYQGIVALNHDTLAEVVTDYFRLSEQIDTELIIRAGAGQGRCLLLQKMPPKTEETPVKLSEKSSEDLWEEVTVLLNSVRDTELFSDKLTPDEVLFRLFHANKLVVFDPQTPTAECRCYRGKMENFLKRMSIQERQSLYNDAGEIEVVCQFCGEKYQFKKADFGDN